MKNAIRMGRKHWENVPKVFSSNLYSRHLKNKGLLGKVKIYTDARTTNYGFVEVDYFFYAAKTQKGNDGIVLFENYVFFYPRYNVHHY